MAAADLHARFQALPSLVNQNAGLLRRGRGCTVTFLVELGDSPYLVEVHAGRVAALEPGPFLMRPWQFAVRADLDAWQHFWAPVPAPGYHDLFAMKKAGVARIEGDLTPLMRHLRYFQEVLAAPRHPAPAGERPGVSGDGAASGDPGDAGDAGEAGPHGPELEPIVGRYLRLTLGGRRHRVYFEEAGHGIPLVCLHTAGADGRQFRHLMNDPAVTRRHRVLAFDMPWHGKSLPPAGWQDEEYRLTTGSYVEMILAFCGALRLERPVVLGCSIGGKIVLQLALEHGARFRALIGLEAAAYQPPWYDDTGWLHRPDIHGGEICGALMSGLMAPDCPPVRRWETLWGYMQGGPGVFRGDLHFYRVDGDFRDRVERIDTTRCPLYLLTGEYDFSCTPDDTRRTAAAIPGARLTVMPGLGHFPMSEDPRRFRAYLLPVLDEIQARG